MASAFSNKKKVRGWKRRIQQAERWLHSEGALDLIQLKDHGSWSAEIWFAPWGNLTPREPPFWYRRVLLRYLVEIHDDWEQLLLQEFGDGFYLRLWLFDPHFHASQVVAAVGQRVAFYERRFQRAPELRGTPLPSYEGTGYDLQRFDWAPCVHDERYSVRDDGLNADDIAGLEKRSARREASAAGDEYVLHLGSIWIGQRSLTGVCSRRRPMRS
jgi:hypothetical protein